MSNAPGRLTDRVTEFVQRLRDGTQRAETKESGRVPSIVKTGARDGTPAIVAGALLLWRAVRSTRHGSFKAVAQVALGIVVFCIGVRQRRLDTTRTSSEENAVGGVTTAERDRLDDNEQSEAAVSNPSGQHGFDEESEPTTSGENGTDRELGGDLPGELSDPAFTADAETQGRSQPSLNADVHDPRRGRGDDDVDLSETALGDDATEAADSSTERDRHSQTDEHGDVLGSEGERPDGEDDDDTNGEGNTADPDRKRNDEDGSERGK